MIHLHSHDVLTKRFCILWRHIKIISKIETLGIQYSFLRLTSFKKAQRNLLLCGFLVQYNLYFIFVRVSIWFRKIVTFLVTKIISVSLNIKKLRHSSLSKRITNVFGGIKGFQLSCPLIIYLSYLMTLYDFWLSGKPLFIEKTNIHHFTFLTTILKQPLVIYTRVI